MNEPHALAASAANVEQTPAAVFTGAPNGLVDVGLVQSQLPAQQGLPADSVEVDTKAEMSAEPEPAQLAQALQARMQEAEPGTSDTLQGLEEKIVAKPNGLEAQAQLNGVDKDSSGTDTDDAGDFIKMVRTGLGDGPVKRAASRRHQHGEKDEEFSASPEKPRRAVRGVRAAAQAGGRADSGQARRGGTVTILDLIEYGLIVPGPNVLRSDYKNAADYADLLSDGRIRQDGNIFDSPSAFSVWSKRKLTPDRKSDDGWKSLKYRDEPLEHYKNIYLERVSAMQAMQPVRAQAVFQAGASAGGQTQGDEPETKRLCLPGLLPPLGPPGPGAGAPAAKKSGGLPGFAGGLPPLYLSPPGAGSTLPGLPARAGLPPLGGQPMLALQARAAPAPVLTAPPPVKRPVGRPPKAAKIADGTYVPKSANKGGDAMYVPKGTHVAKAAGKGAGKGTGRGPGRPKGSKTGAGRGGRVPRVERSFKEVELEEEPPVEEAPLGRSRRCVKQPRRFGVQQHADHSMVPLEQYKQLPGSSLPDAQPFKISVHPVALVAMDIHAHLCQHEVIGVLGGRYNPELRTIDIFQARSVKELIVDSDAHINVEMDPVDQQRVVQELHACNLQCVGWYHSHPTFPALPSGIDVLNQVTHQMHHRTSDGPAPYIAAIVGPYHQKNNGLQSVVTWFYVERDDDAGPSAKSNPSTDELLATCLPKALQVESMQQATLTSLDIFQLVGPLVTTYARYSARTDFSQEINVQELWGVLQLWREKTTHLQKMVASMYTWCHGHLPAEDMYEVGKKVIDFAWRTFYPQPE